MSEKKPSCMRAPPLAENMMSGRCASRAYSIARVIFSPTPVPMLPMKNSASSTASTAGWPSMRPVAVITASCIPVFSRCAASFFS